MMFVMLSALTMILLLSMTMLLLLLPLMFIVDIPGADFVVFANDNGDSDGDIANVDNDHIIEDNDDNDDDMK